MKVIPKLQIILAIANRSRHSASGGSDGGERAVARLPEKSTLFYGWLRQGDLSDCRAHLGQLCLTLD